MNVVQQLYKPAFGLLTDLYQLTMAYAYWRSGLPRREAAFHLFFRKEPFNGAFAICAGLQCVIDALNQFRFDDADIGYLATLNGNDGEPLFEDRFLDSLRTLRFTGQLDAIPEGTVVFAHEPLVRVCGPLLECQLLESMLLNIVNFQTLIATKSSRVCLATRGEPVLEFGLRRAQGIDGAISASRAAYIGGCAATSNVLAGRLYDIPVKGTHAHSWVMTFGDELTAFREYAQALPNNCVFLVDTYDTTEGVRNAIRIGRELRERGHEMVGVRLDSGDLAELSILARRLLDEAGFPDAAIVASNDLDEQLIASLKEQGATITVWGVGTKLATAYDHPALGGVYKLAAIRDADGQWRSRIKLSEQAIKISNPGIQQVRRFQTDAGLLADVIYDELTGISDPCTMVETHDPTRKRVMPSDAISEDLLVPVIRDGENVYESPSIHDIRRRTASQLEMLTRPMKRRLNPQPFPVGLDIGLADLKSRLVQEARRNSESR